MWSGRLLKLAIALVTLFAAFARAQDESTVLRVSFVQVDSRIGFEGTEFEKTVAELKALPVGVQDSLKALANSQSQTLADGLGVVARDLKLYSGRKAPSAGDARIDVDTFIGNYGQLKVLALTTGLLARVTNAPETSMDAYFSSLVDACDTHGFTVDKERVSIFAPGDLALLGSLIIPLGKPSTKYSQMLSRVLKGRTYAPELKDFVVSPDSHPMTAHQARAVFMLLDLGHFGVKVASEAYKAALVADSREGADLRAAIAVLSSTGRTVSREDAKALVESPARMARILEHAYALVPQARFLRTLSDQYLDEVQDTIQELCSASISQMSEIVDLNDKINSYRTVQKRIVEMIRNMNVEIEKLPAEQRETFRKLLLSPVENMIKEATDCEATGKIGDRIVPPSRR